MSTITKRKDGRFEIRESVTTSRGPRSRTLAIFSRLSTDDLDHAEERASRPFDRASVRARAEELGVPWVGPGAVEAARAVVAAAKNASALPAAFRGAVREALGCPDPELPDTIPPMLHWVGATDEQRGRALRDLLRLAEAIVRAREGLQRGELEFPPFRSARSRG